LSVIPFVTGDEVIKFWKVKIGGEVCALLNALLVSLCAHLTVEEYLQVFNMYCRCTKTLMIVTL